VREKRAGRPGTLDTANLDLEFVVAQQVPLRLHYPRWTAELSQGFVGPFPPRADVQGLSGRSTVLRSGELSQMGGSTGFPQYGFTAKESGCLLAAGGGRMVANALQAAVLSSRDVSVCTVSERKQQETQL